ncbi:uncharacterized protein UTRI_06186_B [Ustilago trichophora]|uniref:Uncharacterized protein n=1 Tax=Ustilago trichophora TaxID=86804 RepID=A0A5C3EH79_9BASI|nr:uncharacterized protein UTRI_06186_B [Ustilago trichophora]
MMFARLKSLLTVVLLLLFTLCPLILCARQVDEPPRPPDIRNSIIETAFSQRHALQLYRHFHLSEHDVASIEPTDQDIYDRFRLHIHEPNARFMLSCHPSDNPEECLFISPYVRERWDRWGRLSRERVIMMLVAKYFEEVRPAGLVHLPEGSSQRFWDWVNHFAVESKESLVNKWGPLRFDFPPPPWAVGLR